MKDPAFLFYSKDFYESTRTMLPIERACYIDLLIYQHQNGFIPNDVTRLTLYCSGVGDDVIRDVLKMKFNQTVDGWLNHRMTDETEKRNMSKPKKCASATFAGLISSSKLTKKQILKLKESFDIDHFIHDDNVLLTHHEIKNKVRKWFSEMVNQMVNNLVNVNANKNIVSSSNTTLVDKKGVLKTKPEPTIEEVLNHLKSKPGYRPWMDLQIRQKYEAWKDNDWHDFKDNKIRNVLSKFTNYMPHFKKPENSTNGQISQAPRIPMSESSRRMIESMGKKKAQKLEDNDQ